MGVDVVGGPGGAYGFLAADVPHDELDVFVHHLLHVAPYRRGRRYHLIEQPSQASPPPNTQGPVCQHTNKRV